MLSPRVYADNASAMWTNLAPAPPQAASGYVRIESPTFTRVILREPMPADVRLVRPVSIMNRQGEARRP